jgi:orotidine-5'-phosphate decarboxylase
MPHFADRLGEFIRARGNPLCVGLDPRWDSLPAELRARHDPGRRAAAFEEFCGRVLDIVAPIAAVVKPQSAFFESCGPEGMAVLLRLIRKARALGLLTILDGKRGDIATTAAAYAEAAFDCYGADALTINPYLGRDAVEPFLATARRHDAGVFVLVRTSNPGAGLFQDLVVSSPDQALPLYQHVGLAVARWARENLGKCGLGDVGAVIGATYPAELQLLRQRLPEVLFLLPGFGAQGGTAEDVRAAFRSDGSGAVVSSSRGVLFPFRPEARDWESRIEMAARQAAEALAAVQQKP